MLPSGADVKIGSYEFMLADGLVETAYEYVRRPIDVEIAIWDMDDWSGGEGLRFWDPDQPTRYWFGKANPRTPGSVTAPPPASTSTQTATDALTQAVLVPAVGALWAFAARSAWYSTDGTTWTAHPNNPLFGTGYAVTAAAGVGNKIWVSAHDGTTRKVLEVDTSTSATAVNDVTGPPFLGMAQRGGYVYGWTGKTLIRYNSQDSLPIAQSSSHKVYQPFLDVLPNVYYGGAVATDRSIMMFFATKGGSVVHEFRGGRGVDVWHLPGLTVRGIAHRSGILYALADAGRTIELHAMGVANRQPLYLATVGEGDGVNVARCLGPGHGSTVLIGASDGTNEYVYVYDPDTDGVSQLDTLSSGGALSALTSFERRRVAAQFSGTTLSLPSWASDASASGSWSLVSPAWDLGKPYMTKQLLGVHVVQDPAGGTCQVLYDADETGTFTSVGTTTSGSKHTYLDVSASNITGKTFRFKLTGSSACKVLSVAPRFYTTSYDEIWSLSLAITDQATTARPRSTGGLRASVLRGYLRSIHANRQVVTFLDGRRFQLPGGDGVGYSTHSVVVDAIRETVGAQGEGVCEVVLRSVTPT